MTCCEKRVTVKVLRVANVKMPEYGTENAAAMDFCSANVENITINPGEQALIPLGIKVAVPVGYKLTLKPRSGLAFRRMISVTNSPGTIDADYRGEVKAILINLGKNTFL